MRGIMLFKWMITIIIGISSASASALSCFKSPSYFVLNCDRESNCDLVGGLNKITKPSFDSCDSEIKKATLDENLKSNLFKILIAEAEKPIQGIYEIVVTFDSLTCDINKNPSWSDYKTALEYFVSVDAGCISYVRKFSSKADLSISNNLILNSLKKYPSDNGSESRNSYLQSKFWKTIKSSKTEVTEHEFSLMFQEMAKSEISRFEAVLKTLKEKCKNGSQSFCKYEMYGQKLLK